MFRTTIAALAVIFIASSAQASDKNLYLETQVGTTVKADDGRDNSNIMGLAIGKYLPAGVSYALIDTIDFTAQYQMLTSGSIAVTNASGLEDWDSQSITVGVRYGF